MRHSELKCVPTAFVRTHFTVPCSNGRTDGICSELDVLGLVLNELMYAQGFAYLRAIWLDEVPPTRQFTAPAEHWLHFLISTRQQLGRLESASHRKRKQPRRRELAVNCPKGCSARHPTPPNRRNCPHFEASRPCRVGSRSSYECNTSCHYILVTTWGT